MRLAVVASPAALVIIGTSASSSSADSPLYWTGPTLIDQQPPFANPRAISDMSCSSDALCVAVGAGGELVRSTDPTSATPTWTTTNLDGTVGARRLHRAGQSHHLSAAGRRTDQAARHRPCPSPCHPRRPRRAAYRAPSPPPAPRRHLHHLHRARPCQTSRAPVTGAQLWAVPLRLRRRTRHRGATMSSAPFASITFARDG